MNKTKSLVLIGAFAALLAVCAQIAIPLPAGVALTLQTLAVALCGYTLGPLRAMASVGVYLLLGAVGLPVFASFRGGIGVLFGMTGGFLFGFVPMAALCGLGGENTLKRLLFGFFGLLVCHAAGVAQYALVTRTPLFPAFAAVSLPFLLKDAVSVALAYLPAKILKKAIITKILH